MIATDARRGITDAPDPGALGFDTARLARIDEYLRRFVDDGRLAGWQVVVTRHGRAVHAREAGLRDEEAGLPVEPDTRWRLLSMSKPITAVAALILWERGAFELTDPVERWLPAFAAPRVYIRASSSGPITEPSPEPIRIWHLLTHTAGLTYGFHRADPVDEMYRAAGFDGTVPEGLDLAGCVDAWARFPLVHVPGTEWNYGHAIDVLGRLIEVVSGRDLDAFLRDELFGPLGMLATGFVADDPARTAALYAARSDGSRSRFDTLGDRFLRPPGWLSGGGGLVSTAADYHRFTQMLLARGELDGIRVLAPRTVEHLGRNHLPGGVDLDRAARSLLTETPFAGVGFGLGMAVVLDPARTGTLASPGELSWGGVAGTAFWIDPVEDISVLFFTQCLPASAYPLRATLRTLVYQALVG